MSYTPADEPTKEQSGEKRKTHEKDEGENLGMLGVARMPTVTEPEKDCWKFDGTDHLPNDCTDYMLDKRGKENHDKGIANKKIKTEDDTNEELGEPNEPWWWSKIPKGSSWRTHHYMRLLYEEDPLFFDPFPRKDYEKDEKDIEYEKKNGCWFDHHCASEMMAITIHLPTKNGFDVNIGSMHTGVFLIRILCRDFWTIYLIWKV
jgi:hypothetical protein